MAEKTVLVVEDERAIANLLGRLVESCGVKVLTAYNGRDAVQLMREQRPDLVLLDLIMPIMSGEEVLHIMDADPLLQGIPVIIITTRESVEGVPQQNLPLLQKPFVPSQVKRLIMETLGLSEG